MNSQKIFYCLVFYILTCNLLKTFSKSNNNFDHGTRFKSIKCECDNKTLEINYCYLKAISRRIVTANVNVKILVPYVKPYYVQFILYFRYGTVFRQVIDTKQVEWCGLMDGNEVHPYIKLTID